MEIADAVGPQELVAFISIEFDPSTNTIELSSLPVEALNV